MLKKLKEQLAQISFTDLRKWLGNILIGSSLLLFLVIYLPILRTYLPLPYWEISSDKSQVTNNSHIIIPKINASAPLIDNINPWNESEYRAALRRGVAVASGFAKPGESGTTFIFAHSSDSFWNITSYNAVFFRLGELRSGDLVEVTYNGQNYKYSVSHSVEVWPDEVEALTRNSGDQLILQTCTPAGTSLKRLLVFAKRI
jgi:sortase A